jgi:tRNA uridine 5-carboxymethylaminomethyl modification enzyme
LIEKPISREYNLMDLLRRPGVSYADVASLKGQALVDEQVVEQLEIAAKYAGYIDRQQEEIGRLKKYETAILPMDFDYQSIEGLSNEVKQKLMATKPATLAVASRIQGITPAAISLLLISLKKRGLLERKIA